MTLKYSFTESEVADLDEAIIQHQQIFTSIKEYYFLYKPKHHFTTHLPEDIKMYGPLRHFWCFRFEALNQTIKKIAQGSNYQNVTKRVAEYWCFKSARDIKSGKLAQWGLTHMEAGNESLAIARESANEEQQCIFERYYPDRTELMISQIHILSHAGDFYRDDGWILIGEPSSEPNLGKLHGIYDVEGIFFMTVSVYEIPSSSRTAGISGITKRLQKPLRALDVLVICTDEVLMQPVRYEAKPLQMFDEISLVL
jgi:hypothetical protein